MTVVSPSFPVLTKRTCRCLTAIIPKTTPGLEPVPAKTGDAIIFTEALTHGSMVNRSGRPRRTLYYCYSVSWMPDWGGQHLHFSDGFAGRLPDSRRELIAVR